MTVTLRVQYKGEGARKLLADEAKSQEDPLHYVPDITRTLSLFSIPAPHNTRAIYKSGFILCNYNILRSDVSTLFL